MEVSAFITHKKAECFSDCQDRFSINKDTKSIAVSDGMSQSVFQKYWAQILVEEFTSSKEWKPDLDSVRKLSIKWNDKVLKYLDDETKAGRDPWRARRSIDNGRSAGATILGVRFNGQKWTCDVLGDSCLIVIQNNKIKSIITSEEVESFDNYPDYYDSNPKKTGKGTLKTQSGELSSGDVVLLVSDPFSDYLNKHKNEEKSSVLIEQLININSHEEYEALVDEWRTTGMHDDDSTIVIVKEDNSDAFNYGYIDDISQLIADEAKVESEQEHDSSTGNKTTDSAEDFISYLISYLKNFSWRKAIINKKFSRGLSKKELNKIINDIVQELIRMMKSFPQKNS